MLASFISQGLPRVMLDLVLLLSVGGYLAYCVLKKIRPEQPGTALDLPAPAQPELSHLDLLQVLADGILAINAEDQILYASDRATSLLGFTSSELKQRNYQDFIILPDGFDESAAYEVKQGQRTIGIEHAALAHTKNGGRFPVRVTVTPCRQGAVRAVVALRPAVEEKPAAPTLPSPEPASLLSTAERIRKLTTLLGNSRDLSTYDRDFLKALEDTTDHLFADIHLYTCLRSLESKELKAEIQPVHLGQWLEKEALAYNRLAANRGCHLTIPRLAKASPVLMTDEKILSQIYQALMDFSLTTYQSPSVTFHLTHDRIARISTDGQTGDLHVRILLIVAAPEDNRGLPTSRPDESLLETVEADPHIRLARQLLPLLGAELSIDANDYSGLLFQFSLSCKSIGLPDQRALPDRSSAVPGRPAAPQASTDVSPGGEPRKRTGTVFSIAEDSSLRKWVREILMAEGFRVEEYQPGEAIEQIRDGKEADIVVLQRELSTEPDFDLTYEIRQLRKAEDMPILLVHVGDHRDPKISYFCAEDAIDFPTENSILKEKVSALCGRRASS